LPHPANIVGSDFTCVLEVVCRCGEGGNGICQELLKTRQQVDAREAHDTSIKHDV
jgi:hypothetical protein